MSKPLSLLVALALASLSATCVLAATNDPEDVRNVVAGFATAWNHHDMDAFGKLFAADADFVNVAGLLMKGRQDIQMHHAWSHGAIPENTQVSGTNRANYGIFKHSTMNFNQVDVRFPGKDVAIAHVKWELLGDARTPAQRLHVAGALGIERAPVRAYSARRRMADRCRSEHRNQPHR